MTICTVRLPLLLLLDVMWGWALAAVLAQLFSGGNGLAPSLLSVAAVVLGSFGLMSVLRRTDLEEAQLRIVGVAATVVAMFIIIPLEFGLSLDGEGERGAAFGGSIALIALWARGILRARVSDDFEAAAHSALLGIVPVAIAAGAQPDTRGPEAFGGLAIAYVVLAMLVLALYHAGEPGRSVRSLAGQWGAMAAWVVAAAAVLAILAAAVDPNSFGVIAVLGAPLRAVGSLIGRFILEPFFRGVEWLFGLLPSPGGRELEPQPTPENEEPPREEEDKPWSLPVRWLMTGAVVTAIIVGALLLLALLFHRVRRREDDEDEHDDVEREGTLAGDLGDLFAALRRPFRRGPRQPSSAYAIRRLYADVLSRAESEGIARPPASTPSQFAPELASKYGAEFSAGITDAFVASRYGSFEVSDERVRQLNEQWRSLSQGPTTRDDGP